MKPFHDTFPRDLGVAVRGERRAQGLAQEELAMAAGVSVRTLYRIEHGHPLTRLDVLLRVLDALGMRLQTSTGEHR